MGTHPARRLWAAMEPLHDVVYFAGGVRPAGIALGLRGFWMTYFAFRAAPLGPVPAPPVVAAFAGFHPAMVAKALPLYHGVALVRPLMAGGFPPAALVHVGVLLGYAALGYFFAIRFARKRFSE